VHSFRKPWRILLLVVSALAVGCGDPDREGAPGTLPSVRRTISLNGTWDLGQGGLDGPPAMLDRRVPVPGFVDLAEPPYPHVGTPSNERDAFWYRYTFSVPEPEAPCALLRIHKARFGVKAWLNGEPIGAHLGAFTLAEFDATAAIRFDRDNTLLVRVGADKRQVPPTIPTGEDLEVYRWVPGIWDDVDLVLTGAQRIVRVKVEPVIGRSEAVIRTTVRNHGAATADLEVEQSIREWASGRPASPTIVDPLRLDAHTETTVVQRVVLSTARLWSPDDPFLYVGRTVVRAAGRATDHLDTRFGMREVAWRSGVEKGFFLNGQRVFLRGANVAPHRFFQDPQRGRLPWDPDWVRKLLSVYPRALHWNSMRVTLGRAPNLWYDIADEVGLLLADEFMMWSVWSLTQESKNWSVDEMEKEFAGWIQESWNHPSIAWWDAANETDRPQVTEVISRVRGLDPTRAWESGGYNPPQGPHDPIEDHPYLLKVIAGQSSDLKQLETNDGQAPQDPPTAIEPEHAYVLNEYGWLWLYREGRPTLLSFPTYIDLIGLGPHSPETYREAYAYVVGGLTEFWRAHRAFAGVQQFVYLTSSFTNADNFLDVVNLVLEPRWIEYARNAFAPIAVYIDSWEDDYPRGSPTAVRVLAWNDTPLSQPVALRLLTVLPTGQIASASEPRSITLRPLAVESLSLEIDMPDTARYVLYAQITPLGGDAPTVWSRRKVGYEHIGQPIPDPPFPAEVTAPHEGVHGPERLSRIPWERSPRHEDSRSSGKSTDQGKQRSPAG